MNELIVHLPLTFRQLYIPGAVGDCCPTKNFYDIFYRIIRQILYINTGGIGMEQEKALDIREITKAFLDVNRWSISDMAFLTNIPRSTLSEWLSDKRELSTRHMRCVRDFLGGNYVKDASAVCSDLLIKRGTDNED